VAWSFKIKWCLFRQVGTWPPQSVTVGL